MPTPDEIYTAADDGNKLIKASALYAAFQTYHQIYLQDKSHVMHYKGSVANVDALPASGNQLGDVYNIISTGENYA